MMVEDDGLTTTNVSSSFPARPSKRSLPGTDPAVFTSATASSTSSKEGGQIVLVNYHGQSLTNEEIALLKYYERLVKAKEDSERRAIASMIAPPPTSKRVPAAVTTPPVLGSVYSTMKSKPPPPSVPGMSGRRSMIDGLLEESSAAIVDPADDGGGEAASQDGGAGGIGVAAPPKAPIAIPRQHKIIRRPVGSEGGVGGASERPARPPPPPKRPAFDRAELHAALPAEFDVWAGPDWVGEIADDALEVRLPQLSYGGGPADRDTLVLFCNVLETCQKFIVNLCPKDHDGGREIILHFNPRRLERGGSLVVDYKVDSDWVRHGKLILRRN